MLSTQHLISMLLSYNSPACFARLIKHKTCQTSLADVRFLLIHVIFCNMNQNYMNVHLLAHGHTMFFFHIRHFFS